MDVVKFRLEGKTAFFKNPEVNTYLYITYGHIHKIALLGIFGAILGYGGYVQRKKEDIYPEFYEKLKHIKIGIVPNNPKGIIDKKVQKFNNSVGYASKENGGNLIITEQWLENPSWDIYFLLDNEKDKEALKIYEALKHRSYIYVPYLGKNDHIAYISNVNKIENVNKVQNINKINSLFKKSNYEMIIEESDEEFEDDFEDDFEEELKYKYEEKLPIKLREDTNGYVLESLVYTNNSLKNISSDYIYKVNEKFIEFI